MGLILQRTETLVANVFRLTCIVLKRLSECLHKGEYCRIQRSPGSSNPKVSGQDHVGGKVYSQPVKITPAKSLVATTLATSSAFERDDSGKSTVKPTPSSARPIAKGRIRCPPELLEFYRTEKARMIDARTATKLNLKKPPALKPQPTATLHMTSRTGPDAGSQAPSVKSKRNIHKTAPPSKGIAQQDGQENNSGRASKPTTRQPIAASNAPKTKTSTPRSSYQQHIEELERHRVILHSLKREYGRAKAEYERSEKTLQCLRRQDQYPLRFWRKQKTLAEKSLGKTARRMQNSRILERELLRKLLEDEKLLVSKGEKLVAWRRNGKDRWKELSVESG